MTGPLAKFLTALRWQPTIVAVNDDDVIRVRLYAVAWTENKARYIGYGWRVGHSGFDWSRPALVRVEWTRRGGWAEVPMREMAK